MGYGKDMEARLRILIAEDDPTSARYMTGLLGRFGACQVAEDGVQAMELYRAAVSGGEPFDLVCLDVMMPRKNGQEVLEEIRALEAGQGLGPGQGVKVIMTTALGDVRSVMSAYKGGATAYITKPILTERLYETLNGLGLDI